MSPSVVAHQVAVGALPRLEAKLWRSDVLERHEAGSRLVTLYGRRAQADEHVLITSVFRTPSGDIEVTGTETTTDAGYHALTPDLPAAHCFKRELHEQTGVRISAHPWLDLELEVARAVALELERVAMHLARLAGITTDLAFLQGATTYGRLRTTAINTTMRLCDACPEGAIRFTSEPKMASSRRDDLVLQAGATERVRVRASATFSKLFGRSLKMRQVSAGGCNACELNAIANVNFDAQSP